MKNLQPLEISDPMLVFLGELFFKKFEKIAMFFLGFLNAKFEF